MNLPLGYYPHSCLVPKEIDMIADIPIVNHNFKNSVWLIMKIKKVPISESSSGHKTVKISDLMDANLIKAEYL